MKKKETTFQMGLNLAIKKKLFNPPPPPLIFLSPYTKLTLGVKP